MNMIRRNFLKSLPAAGIATTLPAIASPEERIAEAMETIKAAMAEKYPGFSFDTRNDVHYAFRHVNGVTMKTDPYSHAVLVFAYDGAPGTQTARWSRHYKVG